jgi:hypothetical protein
VPLIHGSACPAGDADGCELAKAREENQFALAKARQVEQYKLANRMWWTQLVGTVGGLFLIAALFVTQWHVVAAGNFGPALAIFGMGSTLTAGVYGVNAATKKSLRALTGQPDMASHASNTSARLGA